ncbi:MAG: uroporphyrinogen-III C-methyltransferase [Myxococcota bacterium]|jgi:uroporphyrinogen III methyltransferase/synthase|nr:uroporphyrinogen-III C-methyltransferase [Myxococcota bacterium]
MNDKTNPSKPRVGKVILVGAGPGAPDLLTLRGAAALGEADVVMFDELASDEILYHAPDRAERINVGKRGHDAPTRTQEEITALLVERAMAGDTVVRLKGGDPFVFGRGGEEATACVENGIPWEVVPGVSSSVGALAYAGIPITDRRHAASFAVVTGHKDPTVASEATRWRELGSAVDTLVILMGMRKIGELIAHVIDGGRSPETPAAAVMNGTLATQRVVEAPLGELVERAEAAGLRAPAAIVIGDVVRLREVLSWWERMPLFGKRVLVTRTREQSGDMASALRAGGAEPVLLPMIELVPALETGGLDDALAHLDRYDGLLFTSANTVRAFARRARELELDEEFAGLRARVLCIGPQSARAALEAGLPVHLTGSGRGDSESFLREVVEVLSPSGRRFLLPRSDIGRDVVPDGLRARGGEVDAVEAYRNVPAPVDRDWLREALSDGSIDVLTFASPSAVDNFYALLDGATRKAADELVVAAVGRTTKGAVERHGAKVDVVPDRPGGRELVAALATYMAENRTLEANS